MLTGFILSSIAIVAVGLWFVLRPLFNGRQNLVSGLVLFVALGAAIGSLYLLVGTPAAMNPQLALPARNLNDAVAQLQQRVQSNPKDAQAWLLLGQAQLTTGQPEAQVLRSLNSAASAAPQDADILTQAAETLTLMHKDRQIPDASVGWLQQAVKANRLHQRARWFLGIAQRQRGQDAAAAETWEPLLSIVDRATGEALLLELNEARQSAGLSPLPSTRFQALPPESVAAVIHLSKDLRQSLPESAAIFVTIKQDGQGMPVAAKRYAPMDMPSTVYLSDKDSPMPTAKLSAAQNLKISARISLSGSATRSPDDIDSAEIAVPASRKVELTLTGAAR